MSVYLKDDMVLLDSDLVATSTDCCCGGACCYFGTCYSVDETTCNDGGGHWKPGHTCDEEDLCLGACCFPNHTCNISDVDDCVGDGYTYLGDGTICGDPNPCVDLCTDCAFDAFDASGRKFLTRTEHIVRTAHTDANPPFQDGCDAARDITTVSTATVTIDGCSVSEACSGTATYVNITQPLVEFSNCSWVSDGMGGCHYVLDSGEGIGCDVTCHQFCNTCLPSVISATEASCTCDFEDADGYVHATHTITLSDECFPP